MMGMQKKCTDNSGYILIELAAVLALFALTAAVVGSLLLTGVRRSDQMKELYYKEELLIRIQEQLEKALTYCEDLYITGGEEGKTSEADVRRQMHTRIQTLTVNGDGFLSLNGTEMFGASHFGEHRLGCQVEIGEQSLTLDLWLTKNGEEVGRTQSFIRLYNMELLERTVRTDAERYDNREGQIVFYIGVPWKEGV